MTTTSLVLTLPQGIVTATSFSLQDFADHRSPGSGKYFKGRSILATLALEKGKLGFRFEDEGGWRDSNGDAAMALEAAANGKRTKTALSNGGFSATPLSAWREVYLVKTGGEALELKNTEAHVEFRDAVCSENMSADDIAKAIGIEPPETRTPRLYAVFAPIEMMLLSNLTPAEYVWYATHRPGKVFRKVAFAEIESAPKRLVAESIFLAAREELQASATKKTKTVLLGDSLNNIPFISWLGYDRESEGGLYVGDRKGLRIWSIPSPIPRAWERAY